MENFVDSVRNALDRSGLDAHYLELEVTESLVMVEVQRTVEKLLLLKRMGIKISVDDFGTGFSSLRYLDDLPLDYLKIDRSFIQKMGNSDPQLSLVNTIIAVARTFELETIAEGVETTEQLQQVVSLGCDYIQGYLYSKPVEASELQRKIELIDNPDSRIAIAV